MRSNIDEVAKTIENLKNKHGRDKKAHSYNSRKYKRYPHGKMKKAPPQPREYFFTARSYAVSVSTGHGTGPDLSLAPV